jgi:tripartite ATP-independent transporter DctM subunit
MEWWVALVILLGAFLFLMATGMPVAFCFLLIILSGTYILWGGQQGMNTLARSMFGSVASFTFMALPMFMVMGEIMVHSGIGPKMMDAIEKWLGRMPGRLALVSIIAGTIFATLNGSSQASVAMLGSTLCGDMDKRGYKKEMSLGPILGAGGLAIMIPPSGMAVLLGALGEISIGKLLIGIIVPGIMMAVFYFIYVIVRCSIQPDLAPQYEVISTTFREKMDGTLKYIAPLAIVVFLVVGVIMLGIATPTEAAVSGAVGCIVLAAVYRKLTWKVFKTSFANATKNTIMVMFIIAGALAYSQILSFTGASRGLVDLIIGFHATPLVTMIIIQLVLLFLGMFMSIVPIMMITVPVLMPVIHALGIDPVWFGVIYLLNMEMATISPPFGLTLFVMQAVSNSKLQDVYSAVIPFLLIDLFVMALLLGIPSLTTWLPSIAH